MDGLTRNPVEGIAQIDQILIRKGNQEKNY